MGHMMGRVSLIYFEERIRGIREGMDEARDIRVYKEEQIQHNSVYRPKLVKFQTSFIWRRNIYSVHFRSIYK